MQYWIDGYNLLFRLSSVEGSFSEARKELILSLNRFAKQCSLSFVLVFDAPRSREPSDLRSHYDALEILYAASKQSADEAILDAVELHRNKSGICVVSSDKGLTRRAEALVAETLSLQSFFRFLRKKQRQKTPTPGEFRDSPDQMKRLLALFEERLKSDDSGFF